jgi:glycosyltransferase involved in cell wall biosynthesis
MKDLKILVILPAFNESGNIGATICELKSLDFKIDILVIDDGSTDTTAQEALKAQARVISLPFNLGIGGAVQTGLQYALRNGYDIATQVDGDGQHDAQYLKVILAPVLDDQADFVVGSRFIGPFQGWQSSAVRRVGIRFFAWLISGLTGYTVTDPTSGFRAFNAKAIKVFAEDYPQDFPEPESIMSAKRFGFRLLEVPVQMRKRIHGHSSIRYFKTLYYMIKVTIAILLNMLKKGPKK